MWGCILIQFDKLKKPEICHIRIIPDEFNVYTSHFLGFSIYISNTTNKQDAVLCFKDTIYTRATIPNPVNIECLHHGRYVIYYNNRTHKPSPYGYSLYAYSDLCEVEVYGTIFVILQNRYFLFI